MGNITEKLNYLNQTKQEIKQALIDKGATVNDTDTFRSYAEKISTIETGIDTSDGTAVSSDILEGKVAYSQDQRIVGTLKMASDYNAKISKYTGGEIKLFITEISELDTTNITNLNSIFDGFQTLTKLPNKFNTSNATTIQYAFRNCRVLTDIQELDGSKLESVYDSFSLCYGLVNFGGIKDLGKAYTYTSANYSLYELALRTANKLSHESLMNVINKLYTINITQKLNLGSTNLAKLTADEIAIATNKGWTVS